MYQNHQTICRQQAPIKQQPLQNPDSRGLFFLQLNTTIKYTSISKKVNLIIKNLIYSLWR